MLTRAWAAAFDYIQGIDDEQTRLLKSIYNSYYNSPIQLRDEIAEHNNVTWVRAFRFIFGLWESYLNGSFVDVVQALKLYASVNVRTLTPKVLFQIRRLSDNIFSGITEQSCACDIINNFNAEIRKQDFAKLKETIFAPDFSVPIFTEFDNDKIVDAVKGLFWGTSYKLFAEVFSENSKYMTVHQAKGLEWNKVIVSVTPNKFDKIKIADIYCTPHLIDETPADEFTRMYYVACSRAKEDLYIHISDVGSIVKIRASLDEYIRKSGNNIAYEFVQ